MKPQSVATGCSDEPLVPKWRLELAEREAAALRADRDALAGVLRFYVSLVGNTGYSVDRQGAGEAYELAQQALAAHGGKP